MPCYQHDPAYVHDRGYGGHADRCAPGILDLLAGYGIQATVGTRFGPRNCRPACAR